MKLVNCTNFDAVRIEVLGEARALTIPAEAVLRMRDTQAKLLELAQWADANLQAYISADVYDGHVAKWFSDLADLLKKAEGRE